jgi:LacI family transcriptional regulator
MAKKITLREVATKAGLSLSAVSQALRNRAEISLSTRQRVQAVAQEMGYSPDPALAALAAYRGHKKKQGDYSILGFVHNWKSPEQWRKNSRFLTLFFEGAQARAHQLGYHLEEFSVSTGNINQRRLSDILYHRGIQGLLIPALSVPTGHLSLDWSKFSIVAIRNALSGMNFNYATSEIFWGMRLACHNLRHLGYRRIGFFSTDLWDRYNLRAVPSAHWVEYQYYCRDHYIPPLILKDEKTPNLTPLKQWIKTHRPDVLVSSHAFMQEWIEKCGFRVPQDMAFAALDLPSQNSSNVAGLYHYPEILGDAAVTLLHTELLVGQRGIPVHPRGVSVPPIWCQGSSAPQKRTSPSLPTKKSRKSAASSRK